MIGDYFRLSLNSLKRRRLRSWLTMIGIFIGIAAVVSLIGLGEGLRKAVSSQFDFLGADTITIQAGGVQYGPPGTGVVNPLEKDYVSKIERVIGVEYVMPRLMRSSELQYNEQVKYSWVASMPSGEARKEIETMGGFVAEQGRLLKDGDRYQVVLGVNLHEEDAFGKPVKVGDQILINQTKFEVKGVLKKRGTFTIDNAVLMNEEIMRDLFDRPDEVSVIVVKVEEGANMHRVKEDIEEVLREERNVDKGEEDFSVELATETLESLNSTLFAVQLFVSIIAGISILVGGIGIMNTMFTAVVERTKEIGIMKSIGAKNGSIFVLFLVESGMLGMVGGLIGIVLGVALAKGLAYLGAMQLGSDLIKAHISLGLIIGALLFSFVVGCIAGTTPALRAARLNPVDALRYSK